MILSDVIHSSHEKLNSNENFRTELFYRIWDYFTIQSCNNEDVRTGQEHDINGTWLLYQRFDGVGINPVDNGKTLMFTKENRFIDSFLPDCEGIFSIENDTITIEKPCKDLPIQYIFKFEGNNLILAEFPSTCDEGCYDIYKKS